MGGELLMIPEKGEVEKIKRIFPDNSSFVCPQLQNGKHIGDFWVTWRGNKLELGYSFGSPLNGEWALAVGLEIARHFRIKKAGWDSVGYCKSMDEFMCSKILGYYPFFWKIPKLKKHYEEEARKLLTSQKICDIKASTIGEKSWASLH